MPRPEPRLALCQPEALLTDKSSTVRGSEPSPGFVLLCFKLAAGEGVVSLGVEGEQNPAMLGCIPAVSCMCPRWPLMKLLGYWVHPRLGKAPHLHLSCEWGWGFRTSPVNQSHQF